MPFKPVAAHIYELGLGLVNVWLIEDETELTLIDTGYAGQEQTIVAALAQMGRKPSDIRHILLTHCHSDHVGGLAVLKQISQAQVWMHPADAEVVRGDRAGRPIHTSPGLLNAILFRLFIHSSSGPLPHSAIEHEVQDGAVLPMGGGIRVLHTPGHTLGHSAFLLPQQGGGGVMILGDACSNVLDLGYSIVYEDIQTGRASLSKLAKTECQAVCFSHGKALKHGAVRSFQQKWA